MAPSAEAPAPAYVRRYQIRQLPEKYLDARRPEIALRPDVTFIRSPAATSDYRLGAWWNAVSSTGMTAVAGISALAGSRTGVFGIAAILFFFPFAVWMWIRAVRCWQRTDDELPPFGLSIWDDALVAFGRYAVIVVPRSAARSCRTTPGDHGSGLTVIAVDRRGDTPPRTLGWFAMDPDELGATVAAWIEDSPEADEV